MNLATKYWVAQGAFSVSTGVLSEAPKPLHDSGTFTEWSTDRKGTWEWYLGFYQTSPFSLFGVIWFLRIPKRYVGQVLMKEAWHT